MAKSIGLIAKTIYEFFKKHDQEFENYLLEHCDIDFGTVGWHEDKLNQQLILKIRRVAQDGETVGEDEYSLKLSKI